MTEQYSGRISEFESLPNDAIVYRALLRRWWIDEDSGTVNFSAYLLRPNEQGLSVNIASNFSPEQCAARFRNCYGVASIQVGYIRQLGLDVVPDSRSHAIIIGLPFCEDNLIIANRLAYLLAEQSQIVWRP